MKIYIKIMVLDDEIINLLKNDDNKFFDYYNNFSKWNRKRMIKYIFKYNLNNIALNIIKKNEFIVIIYNKVIASHSKDKNKLLLFILNSLLYVSDDYYSRLINVFIKHDLWEIVDYLHMMGYMAFNKKYLIKNYPKNKIDDLDKYGYNITKKDDKQYDDIFIKKYKKKDKKTIINLCKEQNIDILQKLIDIKNIKLEINELFTLCNIINKKKTKRVASWRKRRDLYNKYNKILNSIISDNIINFIKKNKNNIIVKKNKFFTILCIKNKLYEMFDKNIFLFNNLILRKLYLYFFNNDDVDGFKYLIEQNIVKPIDIYNNKIINVNDTIIDNKPNLFRYFTEELKMNYNINTIFHPYYYTKKNVMGYIKELEKLGFKNDNPKLLNFTAQIGSIDLYNYIDKTKLKFKGKHVIFALKNNNFKFANLLIKNGCKINKNKMLEQIINKKYFYGTNFNKILKNYNCDINEQIFSKIFFLLNYNTIMYLYNKKRYLFEKIDLIKFCDYTCRDSKLKYDKFEHILDYILEYKKKNWDNMMLNDNYEQILYMCIERMISYDIIEKLINKFDFKLTKKFCKNIFNLDDIYNYTFIKLMENHNVIMDDDMITHILIYLFNKETMEYLINKYDFKGSTKLLNQIIYVNGCYLKNDLINFINEKMNIKPSPYTVELFLKYSHIDNTNNFDGILTYMITYVGITQKSYNILKTIKNKNIKKNINKYKIIEYNPLDEEIVDFYDNITESEDEPEDELEKAIQDGLKNEIS
jgi:hypothetical protein